ncbi:ATP-grasp domain-containing protein [Azoarcus indigens]|uniref:3-methylcrotonoyl-CoA carboxylase alpha subunit n=1 Tax=Azoarcus indigens TaxID=29545 RepID=A0A4V6PQS0_9RHOO|nr:biotin carboxylase N-terminal domain-containing protein [Azoarcus indigens]NMG64167.1 ATP-grasp domain-containing protein [Azoarcus indigens]TDN55762.1 3-methylcrotonoyl-CoA carboxylase alpha subunit [Azoarcus indigens]
MFNKILIANRGEIACRVIRTARRMGIGTVAVYSDADAGARHVRLADEARRIGPAPARESYLAGDRIIAAALASGAQAIHPGYGFLSENAGFCTACEAAGLVFIGPPAAAIQAMGSKSEAKKLMQRAGVPLAPGYHGDEQSPAHLQAQADAIGYPLLIKAAAGGGGKGMRRVERSADFAAALAACQREAAASFGSAHVLLERYLTRPRHIEIQVFGDHHGNYVHLFERDCSVQRRHQKVLEEAPAPGMSAERRAEMGRAAVEAARAVGYVGAGTVEFIAGEDFLRGGPFYFMEMNTRLQVEHPVTEMITGLDLVEWQLRVAAGEPLPLAQSGLRIRGHALEARIYAEDPARGFLPATGRLQHLALPAQSRHVRLDAGVEQGDELGPHYDPMIAKLIVWDEGTAAGAGLAEDSRARALARMRQALADLQVAGVANNVDFLGRLVASPSFAAGDLDTGLIEREQAWLFPAAEPVPDEAWCVAALDELLRQQTEAAALASRSAEPASPWHACDGWRMNAEACRRFGFRAQPASPSEGDAEAMQIEVTNRGPAAYLLRLAGREIRAEVAASAAGQLAVTLNGIRLKAKVIADGEHRTLFLLGRSWQLSFLSPLQHAGERREEGGDGHLRAPMPGKVIEVLAEEEASVGKGAPLLVLEAMKMEHTIVAPAAGVVKRLRYRVGEQVEEGADLLDFAPASPPQTEAAP